MQWGDPQFQIQNLCPKSRIFFTQISAGYFLPKSLHDPRDKKIKWAAACTLERLHDSSNSAHVAAGEMECLASIAQYVKLGKTLEQATELTKLGEPGCKEYLETIAHFARIQKFCMFFSFCMDFC